MKYHNRRRGLAFTLIELLVVVAIISLLVSILLPSLGAARKQTRAAMCLSNMRQLAVASFAYVSEWGTYPPSLSNFAHANTAQGRNLRWKAGVDWLGVGDQSGVFVEGDWQDPNTGNPKGFSAAPRFGVIFPSIRSEKVYLCPDDKPGVMVKGTLLGEGGNGKFSYTMFSMLGLRTPENIPTRPVENDGGPSRGPAPGQARLGPRPLSGIPLFVEEHPQDINDKVSSSAHMEGNFNFGTDFVVSRHPSTSVRLGVDPMNGTMRRFSQGSTNIGFADGHASPVKVNFGFTLTDVRPTGAGGKGLQGIPYTAEGLLWHYGIEYMEVRDGKVMIVPAE